MSVQEPNVECTIACDETPTFDSKKKPRRSQRKMKNDNVNIKSNGDDAR